jgi:hypothetical protein
LGASGRSVWEKRLGTEHAGDGFGLPSNVLCPCSLAVPAPLALAGGGFGVPTCSPRSLATCSVPILFGTEFVWAWKLVGEFEGPNEKRLGTEHAGDGFGVPSNVLCPCSLA